MNYETGEKAKVLKQIKKLLKKIKINFLRLGNTDFHQSVTISILRAGADIAISKHLSGLEVLVSDR